MRVTTKLYINLEVTQDDTAHETILDIVQSNHRHFIVGMADGYWRGFPEETLAITISDEEDFIDETIEQLKNKLQHDYIMVDGPGV